MSEIRDIFNKHADSDKATGLCFMSFLRLPNNNHNYNCCHHYHHFFLPAGIVSLMNRFLNILSKEDYELAQQINLKQGIKPHYYAFRWITLMLSQEFSLPGTYVFLWTQLICAALQTWTANKQWTFFKFIFHMHRCFKVMGLPLLRWTSIWISPQTLLLDDSVSFFFYFIETITNVCLRVPPFPRQSIFVVFCSILRDDLMTGDFASNIKLLQSFPDSIEYSHVVARAKTIIGSSWPEDSVRNSLTITV